MRRRTYLGHAFVVGAVGAAGCLGSDHEAINEFGYETLTRDGVGVPLAPVDDVIEWFDDDNLVFIDTRSRGEFEQVRIKGAEWSPAPDGTDDGADPIVEHGSDTRFVTYCVCPHTLATSRGAQAIKDGYRDVYALDEGLQLWVDREYPIEGNQVDE